MCGLIATLDEAAEALRLAAVGQEHEDAYVAIARTASGVTASLEASRVATGWKGRQHVELVGSRGSLWWDLEDLNRLHVYLRDDEGARSPASTTSW